MIPKTVTAGAFLALAAVALYMHINLLRYWDEPNWLDWAAACDPLPVDGCPIPLGHIERELIENAVDKRLRQRVTPAVN